MIAMTSCLITILIKECLEKHYVFNVEQLNLVKSKSGSKLRLWRSSKHRSKILRAKANPSRINKHSSEKLNLYTIELKIYMLIIVSIISLNPIKVQALYQTQIQMMKKGIKLKTINMIIHHIMMIKINLKS